MSSWLLMFLLLLLILIQNARGARLISKGSAPSAGLPSFHQEKFGGIRSNEGEIGEWRSKKLSGSIRNLITMEHISSTTTNIVKNENKQAEEMKEENLFVVNSRSKTQPTDADILDIAAMDYTLARRKPPIHN